MPRIRGRAASSTGTSRIAASTCSSGLVISVGRYAVTPVSSSASPGAAVAGGVCIEEVDAAEAVHLQVDEARYREPAAALPAEAERRDPAVLDLDVARDEHSVDERCFDSQPSRHRTSLEVVPVVGQYQFEQLCPRDSLVSGRVGLYHRAVAAITLDAVTKAFGAVKAVDGVSLEVGDGEFLVLVGPSGCGKSTLLRLLAGLEDVTDGTIKIGDRDVTDLAPRSRDIAMVFQSYALYPHMTVRQNLGYGLRARKTPKDEIARRVGDVAELLGLADLLDRRPAQLSGGQRQRVAMGRAIVRQPQAFLLDEPLSNLDAKLRVGMRASLAQLHQRLGVTTVYVTHDQTEAMTLGQRVAVMRDGHILQCDQPLRAVRAPERPLHRGVHRLAGDEPGRGVPRRRARSGSGSSRCPPRGCLAATASFSAFGPRRSRSAIRRLPTIDVRVEVVEDLGSETHLFFPVDAQPITAEVAGIGFRRGIPERRRSALHCPGRRRRRRLPSARPWRSASMPPASTTSMPTAARASTGEPMAAARRGAILSKQRETRERVLELIDELGVGDAIPSERQLGLDLSVSRLTVRAALDELVREGYLVRRRGAGTFVAEPKVAKGHRHHVVQRRHAGPRPHAGEPHDRAPHDPGRRAPRSHPARVAVRACRRRQAPPPRRR